MPVSSPKLITVLGPTASGKSTLAINLAKKYRGEIVGADSRQIYRGLDIGAGKITKKEMRGVPHHLLDIRQQGQSYSVAQFQKEAVVAINDILQRKKLPFLVGGTALYIYAVVDNYQFSEEKIDRKRREELSKMSLPELQDVFNNLIPRRNDQLTVPTNDYQNPRRLIRAIEKLEAGLSLAPKKARLKYDTLILGIDIPRPVLYKKIDERVEARLKQGMIEEVEKLRKIIIPPARPVRHSLGEDEGGIKGGGSDDWLLSLGLEYRFITEYLQGKRVSKEEMVSRLKTAIHAFARRQMTWFRRDKRIIWIKNEKEAVKQIKFFLYP